MPRGTSQPFSGLGHVAKNLVTLADRELFFRLDPMIVAIALPTLERGDLPSATRRGAAV
jgi:hypothetical protein